jgi:hypothetical protein
MVGKWYYLQAWGLRGGTLLMFAVLDVDAMVRSSLPHGGLFPEAFDSFLLSTQNLLTRVSTFARHPEYSI